MILANPLIKSDTGGVSWIHNNHLFFILIYYISKCNINSHLRSMNKYVNSVGIRKEKKIG